MSDKQKAFTCTEFMNRKKLVAFAIALDGDGVKLSFGDDGNLSVEVDAEITELAFAVIFSMLIVVQKIIVSF